MHDTPDMARLRAIQQELSAAWMAHDRATLERLIAPEWVVTHVMGERIDRAEALRDMVDSDATQMTANDVDEIEIRVFGDAAVVTGRTHASGTQSGAPFDVWLRFTDVFVRRGDQWQAVASHASLIGS